MKTRLKKSSNQHQKELNISLIRQSLKRKLSETISLQILLLICLLGGGSLMLTAQDSSREDPPDLNALMSKPGANYYEIKSQMEDYIKRNSFTTEEVEADDELFSKAARWVNFWEGRVSNSSDQIGNPHAYVNGLVGYSQVALNFCGSNNNSDWDLIGPTIRPYTDMGVVTAVARHNSNHDIIYLGTGSSGIWKTTNATATTPIWRNITDNLNLPTISITDLRTDPNDNNTIWATTGNNRGGFALGLLKSTDGGANWSMPISYNQVGHNNAYFVKVIVDPNNGNRVFALSRDSIYFTPNGGYAWHRYSNLGATDLNDIHLNPNNSNEFFVSSKGKIWKVNTANSWINLTGNLNYTPDANKAPLISMTNTKLYTLYKSGSNRIEYTSNAGSNWTYQGTAGTIGVQFIVNPSNEDIMYVGDNAARRVAKSVNGGLNFTNVTNYSPSSLYHGVSTHADIREMELLSASNDGLSDELLVGCDGGILYSSSATVNGNSSVVNWVPLNGQDLAITEFFGIDILEQQGVIVGGTQDNNGYTWKDNTWTRWNGGDCYDAQIIDSYPYDTYLQYNHPGTSKGVGFGLTSSSYNHQPPFCNPNATCSWDPNEWWKYSKWPIEQHNGTLYIGRKDMFKLVNGSWVAISDFGSFGVSNVSLKVFAVAPSDPNVMYAAYNNISWGPTPTITLFRSTNGGNTWTDISANFDPSKWAGIEDILIDPDDEDKVWISMNGIWYDPAYPGDEQHSQNRVLYSGNKGNTWTDLSDGLPPFSVNKLAFQEGGIHCLYAATDVGVFYKTSLMSSWECYQNSFPIAKVTDLEIDYCANKLIASTFGRGVWESPLAVSTSFANKTYNSSQTLTGDQYLRTSNVIVNSGVTLTLQNANIYMIEGAKIIIKPGGHLIVDNTKITNGCGELWQGIEVWGNSNMNQFVNQSGTYDQGRLTTRNNSVIENAKEAVRLWNPNDWNSPGGIVQASNTTFRNNWRSVEFISYENHFPSWYPSSLANKITNNRSYFNNCTFIHDAILNNGNYPNNMVTMWQVRGIRFSGCTFEYTYDHPSNVAGIYTINADFSVRERCTGLVYPCSGANLDKSRFVNIPRGIVATAACELRSFQVNDSEFEDCSTAILFDGVDDAFIVGNSITYTKPLPVISIYGQYSDRFKLEDNEIDMNGQNHSYSFGIIISNSGGNYNELYNNSVTDASYAIYALGNNFENNSAKIDDGLKFICNKMAGTATRDILAAFGTGAGQIQGEYSPQQFGYLSAHNTFTSGLSTTSNEHHYYNGSNLGNTVMYYGWPDQGGLIYKPTALLNTNFIYSQISRGCASNYGDHMKHGKRQLALSNGVGISPTYGELRLKFDNSYSNYLSSNTNYLHTIDGGSTSNMLSHIDNASMMDPEQLKEIMIDASPLSREVLHGLVLSDALDNNQLTEVFNSNTHVGRESSITDLLLSKPNPFFEHEVDALIAAGRNPNLKDQMEGEMAYYKANYSHHLNQLIDYQVSDTVLVEDSVASLFNEVPKYGYYLGGALFQQAIGNGATAYGLLQTADNKVNMTDEEQLQNTAILDILDDYDTQFAGDDSWSFSPDFSNVLNMHAANKDTKAGTYARNLLRFAAQEPYDITINLPDADYRKKALLVEGDLNSSTLEVYPNPAQDYTVFKWKDLHFNDEAFLVLYSIEGKEVYRGRITDKTGEFHFGTASFGAGLYLYTISNENEVIHTGKLSIQH